jgi:hypothetical protein
MKISHSLRRQISAEINDTLFDFLCLLDDKFRQDEIDHKTWHDLYSDLIQKRSKINQGVLEKIESYTSKR